MGSGVLALDVVLSAVFFFAGKWTPALKRNQSRDLLRFLLCRLCDQSRGQLMVGQITLAQSTLARKLGLSRQWVGELVHRLEAAGWIEHYSPTLPDGTNGSTIFRVGRQLKRLLMMLLKSRKRKTPIKSDANRRWQWSSPPVPVTELGSRRGTAAGWRFGDQFLGTHCLVVQLEPPSQAAKLLLFKLTKTLLAPAVTDANQHRKD
jgi:hypothetical protein